MPKNIGVLGLGSIGMRHAKNLIEMGHKVYGCDPEPKPPVEGLTYIGYEELAHPIEALVIASPTKLHAQHIEDHAGIPMFVEKPIADTVNISRTSLDSVKMVGYNLRFHSCVKMAVEWVPLLEKPQRALFECLQFNDKPDYLRDGVILNWSHEIDLALHLLGQAKFIASRAKLTEGGYDESAHIDIKHEHGCGTCINLDYLAKPEHRQFTIMDGNAKTYTNCQALHCDLVWRSACFVNPDGTKKREFEGFDSFDDNYKEEMRAFIDRLDGKTTIGCTASEAMDTLRICLAARKNIGLI